MCTESQLLCHLCDVATSIKIGEGRVGSERDGERERERERESENCISLQLCADIPTIASQCAIHCTLYDLPNQKYSCISMQIPSALTHSLTLSLSFCDSLTHLSLSEASFFSFFLFCLKECTFPDHPSSARSEEEEQKEGETATLLVCQCALLAFFTSDDPSIVSPFSGCCAHGVSSSLGECITHSIVCICTMNGRSG